MGQVAPRRAGSHHPPQYVQHLTQVVLALGRVLSNKREVWGGERPLFVRNVARVRFSSRHERNAIAYGLKFITLSRPSIFLNSNGMAMLVLLKVQLHAVVAV